MKPNGHGARRHNAKFGREKMPCRAGEAVMGLAWGVVMGQNPEKPRRSKSSMIDMYFVG
jgi:hypothetical protein